MPIPFPASNASASHLAIIPCLLVVGTSSNFGLLPNTWARASHSTSSIPQKISRHRVWYINLEDPQQEIDRRFAAIFKHYEITQHDLGNRLFTDSGREKNFIVAHDGKNGIEFDKKVIADIENTIRENAIDALVVDPYVNCARVPENDNNKMAAVIKTVWAEIAERQNCAVLLEHHVRKGAAGNDGYTVEDARGAGALINSWRMVRVFNTMTKEEGEKAGVERHRSYFRIDNGKVNLTPPPEASEWRKFVSIPLGNATDESPEDKIGVVTRWEWPDPMKDLTVTDLRAAQKAMSEGGPWRADSQAKDWVGKPIAAALRLDLDSKAGKAKVKGALKIWITNGMFREVEGEDEKRKKKTFIEVGTWAGQTVETTRMKTPPQKKNDRVQPIKVAKAPDGVACVFCSTMDERPVWKIRDGRVPYGQPGGKPECLHESCAEKWFTGQFHP